MTVGGDGRLKWKMALSLAWLLSGRLVSEIHVTTLSNVSAIVGKCGARTKAFERPLCQGREADVRCAATIPVKLESALLQKEAEPEMKRLYPGITMCWAANNYCKRRSEQALLWEGSHIAERQYNWRSRTLHG